MQDEPVFESRASRKPLPEESNQAGGKRKGSQGKSDGKEEAREPKLRIANQENREAWDLNQVPSLGERD